MTNLISDSSSKNNDSDNDGINIKKIHVLNTSLVGVII